MDGKKRRTEKSQRNAEFIVVPMGILMLEALAVLMISLASALWAWLVLGSVFLIALGTVALTTMRRRDPRPTGATLATGTVPTATREAARGRSEPRSGDSLVSLGVLRTLRVTLALPALLLALGVSLAFVGAAGAAIPPIPPNFFVVVDQDGAERRQLRAGRPHADGPRRH